jgi:hypothetical protein
MIGVRGWNRFWFTKTSAKPLGVFRILFSLCALVHLILLAPDLVRFVSDEGVLRGEEAKQLAGPLRYSVLQDFQTPGAVRVVFAITTTAAVLTGVGLWTRVTSFVLYLGLLSLHHRNLLTNSGADTILVILSFLLAMAPSGRAD